MGDLKETKMSTDQAAAELKKKRTFRKFTYRGVDLDQLLDMNNEQLMELFPCRIRRKIGRGLKRKPMALIKKLRKKKKECPPSGADALDIINDSSHHPPLGGLEPGSSRNT